MALAAELDGSYTIQMALKCSFDGRIQRVIVRR
jgi:hypothetical protein